jgi:pyruvate kinase
MFYDIVVTLGPASAGREIWAEMLATGVTAFRLNTSHLNLSDLLGWIDRLEPFLAACSPRPPLVLDLQGSKWRLGQVAAVELSAGQQVDLILADQSSQASVLPVPHADFFAAALQSSHEIVLNDAKVRLVVETAGPQRIRTRVVQGGPVSARKGITFRSSEYRLETLNARDEEILTQTRQLAGIRYAISYVRDAAEMERYRALLGSSAYLIAKLERQPALESAAVIARPAPGERFGSANELWLCRGDLGAELGLKGMAEQSHLFSKTVKTYPVPVLLAGQVLEHMTANPAPTRSEVSTLYESLVQGYRGAVLSDETAIGRYPVEACRTAALFK